jgi:hypothetical protein
MKPITIIYNYQTLIAGILAVGGAIGTVLMINKQIRQSNKQEQKRRSHQNFAARAMMPAALSALSDYSEKCIKFLLLLLPIAPDEHAVTTPISDDIPLIPSDELFTLKQCMEFGDEPITVIIADLIRKLQIQHSRLRDMKSKPNNSFIILDANIIDYILDALEIYARCAKLFTYARRERDSAPSELEKFDMISAAHNCGIWDNSKVDAAINTRYNKSRLPATAAPTS